MTEPSARLNISLPHDLTAVFADFASVWHTPDVFVLDFITQDAPPMAGEDELLDVPATVVQRVRIPPRQVFELMKAMEAQLGQWEAETGRSSS